MSVWVTACTQGVDSGQLAEDDDFCQVVASLKYSKGNFRKLDRPEAYLHQALSVTQRTGEKQTASVLDLVASFGEAARLKKVGGSAGKALRDIVSGCVADFNRQVSKAHLLGKLIPQRLPGLQD